MSCASRSRLPEPWPVPLASPVAEEGAPVGVSAPRGAPPSAAGAPSSRGAEQQQGALSGPTPRSRPSRLTPAPPSSRADQGESDVVLRSNRVHNSKIGEEKG